MKKILYIVLDGLGDLPIKELGNKTPLEAAATPCLDRLAQRGKSGLVFPAGKNIAPESDVAVLSLLGYDVQKYYTGRGPLECFAEGLQVFDGDLAYRVNFATLAEDKKNILDRRVGRNLSTEEAGALAREVNSKVILSSATFEFKSTIGHRGVLVIRSQHGRLSAEVTNTDPAYGKEGVFGVALERFDNVLLESKPLAGQEKNKEAVDSADLTNEFIQKSQRVLEESVVNKKRKSENKPPANVILARDAGSSLPKFPSLQERFGLKFGSFVQMPVEKGIALLSGMELIELPLSSGHLDVDYAVWAKVTLDSINKYNGLYIHIKGPDEPAHDGDCKKKKDVIEAIDKFFFANLVSKLDFFDNIIAVTADHSTPCLLKAHSSDPVPLLVAGGNVTADGSLSFSEKAAKEGSLGELVGQEIIPLLVQFADNLRS